jgi:hypothetical protein
MPFLKGDPDWPQLLRPHCPGSWGYIHGAWRDQSVRRAFLPMSSAPSAIGEGIVSKEKNCLIVRAAGRQLDLLRGEASRTAKGSNVDWWVDQAQVGTRFCFEDAKAKESFAVACDNFGIPCQDG